jgi:hypothetical protein
VVLKYDYDGDPELAMKQTESICYMLESTSVRQREAADGVVIAV